MYTDQEIYQTIFDSMLEYSKVEDESPVHLDPTEHISFEGSVPVSSLGFCPRAKAMDRRRLDRKFPELHLDEQLDVQLKFMHGRDSERRVVKSLIHRLGEDAVEYEGTIHSEEMGVHGRFDAVVDFGDGVRRVLELKKSEDKGYGKTTTPDGRKAKEPFFPYCYQVLTYMLVMGIEVGHIVIVTHGAIDVWTLHEENEGYRLYHHTGVVWNNALNNPQWLNEVQISRLARTMHSYMEMSADQLYMTRPLDDPYNMGSEEPLVADVGSAWQCIKLLNKPRTKTPRPGTRFQCQASCAYSCLPDVDSSEPFDVVYDDDGMIQPDLRRRIAF